MPLPQGRSQAYLEIWCVPRCQTVPAVTKKKEKKIPKKNKTKRLVRAITCFGFRAGEMTSHTHTKEGGEEGELAL
jgi:phage FluMu protein Com